MTAASHHTDTHEPDVWEMLDELTLPHHHDEVFDREVAPGSTWTRIYRVHTPPLLDQLGNPTPTAAGETSPVRSFESQPAAHLESLDLLAAIDRDAERLAQVDRGSTIATVRYVGTMLGTAARCARTRGRDGCCDWHRIEHQIHRWWAMARVVAGWDDASWRPNATCPACSRRGGLRIRVKDRIGTCIECRETWHTGTIELLGMHIRDETLAAAIAERRTACALADGYEPPDLDHVCPACGRARCLRGIALALTCPTDCSPRRCGRVAADTRAERRAAAERAAALRRARLAADGLTSRP